jgi:hypothetical protein
LRGCAATRHALDRFHGSGYGFGIRLWPAKVSRKALKEIFNFLGCDRLFIWLGARWIGLWLAIVWLTIILTKIALRPERVGILGHGNLMVDIVGEFSG